MSKSKYTGKYTDAFLSEDVSDYSSILKKNLDKRLEIKNNEAVYIYSFKEKKMIFSQGFESVLNKKDDEINLKVLNSEYDELSKIFVNEYHDRALLYLHQNNLKLTSFSSRVIVKCLGIKEPLSLKIQVFKTNKKGNLDSIIGRVIKNKNLRYSDIIQYSFDGDFEEEFLFQMNHQLDFDLCISSKEIKIIELIKSLKTHQEIGRSIQYPTQKINDVIQILLLRFSLKSESDLVKFAERKMLIPNQFE